MEKQRKKINSIDADIIKLLAERRDLSKEIINLKNEKLSSIRDKPREKELLTKIVGLGKKSGLDSYFVTKVFNEIIGDSVKLQNQIVLDKDNPENLSSAKVVAIQGIEGSYSYLAAQKYFGDSNSKIIFKYKDSFEEVVLSVENKEADYAMLPIENTTSGSINDVYDALIGSQLSIVGEEIFHVKHCLVALKEIALNKIERVYTQAQAARQCNKFLAGINNASVEYFIDTARSIKKIKEENNNYYAAIASEEAAKLFNVVILRENIANQPGNFTRFLICAREPITVDLRIPAKTSVILATSHTAGSLVNALSIFRDFGVNMTKLQSRPIMGNPWEEMFYLDFIGNSSEKNILQLLDELGKIVRFIRVLGCYPSKEVEKTTVEVFPDKSKDAAQEQGLQQIERKESKPKTNVSYKLASREYKNEDTIVTAGNVTIGGDKFIIIAGPCSVESKEQIMSCAREAKENYAQILRGGCFKPRTSPYSFQGLGDEGLQFLKDAGNTYELPVITEVLTIDQVSRVAEHADILQIGARNMQNFALLSEAGKSLRPILLKRGMMSSLDELLNAAEYILARGNRQVILCERGIRTFETATRNTLDLSAIPFIKERSHLPIIVDPSHAIGQRDKITPLAKAAKAVGADGIMVEIHPDPDNALSDGPQSLYFNQFKNLMSELAKM
ncbi:MAG: bifunctional 3-deoxy-7-phosphoheptulonate synthase/chorismate mutase [Bacteroidetes bacterium]|nr:bifunctional 3-deoxy-7-phosphoheptulonate synthase/chorismate mutase [Bacteroidota bacterium]MCH9028081.1 bifunctional 3-deoxy-7-phosphoheptulonate synthase/chorismate mutase [Bacteroidota bacterium]